MCATVEVFCDNCNQSDGGDPDYNVGDVISISSSWVRNEDDRVFCTPECRDEYEAGEEE